MLPLALYFIVYFIIVAFIYSYLSVFSKDDDLINIAVFFPIFLLFGLIFLMLRPFNYIGNYFKINEKKEDPTELIYFLSNNKFIRKVTSIPIILEFICLIWKNDFKSNLLTITELYELIIENFFKYNKFIQFTVYNV